MADTAAFRTEVRHWLADNLPSSLARGSTFDATWGGRKTTYPNPDVKLWLDRMAQRGWTAPTWPPQYGGGGLSKEEATILDDELKRANAPAPLISFGLQMLGPMLLRFGSEAQKQEHLPKICRGEIRWCQGYSEPGAGSDLAALQMRAVRDGEHFSVTGQKIWTSYADESDWIFCLVRTDPDAAKHRGISFLLIDMESPGVETRPITLISGSSPFCEVFFEKVRVPVDNVVGELNDGWTIAKALLSHERGFIADIFVGEDGSLPNLGRRYLGEQAGRLVDSPWRDAIVQAEMDTAAFLFTVQRARDAAQSGQAPGPESSLFKVYATELNQRRRDLMVRLAGPQGLGWEGPGFHEDELQWTRDWLRSRGNTIEGGTSEVQRNIIAKRVLGLPD